MVGYTLLSWVWALVGPLLDSIQPVQINLDGVASSVIMYLRVALYFVPVYTFIDIMSITFALWSFRIFVAVLHAIWASLPFV